MNKAFTRGQTQVLYRFLPQAIFEHDDYGLCKVDSVALGDADINRSALFDALSDALSQWTNSRFRDKFPDPRNETSRGHYALGVPREVRYSPYPLLFMCRSCNRVAKYDALSRSKTTAGKCPTCGGTLVRMRYVQAHNCGRLEELVVPRARCSKGHGPEHLAFRDPGRVRQARWYCKACNTDIQGLRMTPCKCAYNDSLGAGANQYEKWLKVVPTGDPSLYIPHTFAFVNLPENEEARIRALPDALGLMLGRLWDLLPEPVHKVVREREQLQTGDGDPLMAQMVEALRKTDPNHPLVKQYDQQVASPPGQAALDRVAELFGSTQEIAGTPRRWLVEHITLLDRSDISGSRDVAARMRGRGDEEGALQIEQAQHIADDSLGIRDIRVVNDFPLALCAFGYTRITRDPSRSIIMPFPPDDRGRIPIFTIPSETEAIWFQLDPTKVADWLITNGLVAGPKPSGTDVAWAWLYRNITGLRCSPYEVAYSMASAVAVRMLLHTMSHVFQRRVEWSGFSPSSIGEYLIPGSLSFILYANRYAETKIGGLTTLFEQRLGTWLWDAVQSGRECVYDPICTDEGGSCAGCTHREHNCPFFNRELSRAMLYGGPTPQNGELNGMVISQGYWAQAWQAAPEQ